MSKVKFNADEMMVMAMFEQPTRTETMRYIEEVVPFVEDGDDWLELDYVAYLMNLIHQTGAEMAMTDKIFTTRDAGNVPSRQCHSLNKVCLLRLAGFSF